MADILGNDFNIEDFGVIKPKPPKGGGGRSEPKKDENPNDDDSEIEDEVPIKDIEEILEDLKKQGVKGDETIEEPPDDNNIKRGGQEKPEDGGQEKPEDGGQEKPESGQEKPEDGGEKKPEDGGLTDRQRKQKEEEERQREKRKKVEVKNDIANKINSINTFREKHKEILPEREKNILQKSVDELTDLHNSIKID